jgi:hypothetical protein
MKRVKISYWRHTRWNCTLNVIRACEVCHVRLACKTVCDYLGTYTDLSPNLVLGTVANTMVVAGLREAKR